MKDIMLSYVIENMRGNEGYALYRDLSMLRSMIKNYNIDGDYILSYKGLPGKVSLRDFLENKYKECHDEKIIDLLSRFKFGEKITEEGSYIFFCNKLREIKDESDECEISDILDNFVTEGVIIENISNYIKKDKGSEFAINLLDYIFKSPKSSFLFKKIFFEFLNLDKHEIGNYISYNFKKLGNESYAKGVTDICFENPFFKKIVSKDFDASFIEFYISENPYLINDFNLEKQEKTGVVDFYFKNKIEMAGETNPKEYHDILKMKKDWFKVKSENKDLVSMLMENKKLDIRLFIEDVKKDSSLRDYLIERDENVIIEYLAHTNIIKSSVYNKLKKILPELIKRKNKKGLLNYPIGGLFSGGEKSKFIKDLPSNLLMTSDEKELWLWSYAKNFIHYRSYEKEMAEEVILGSVDENFSDNNSELFKEALSIIKMQFNIGNIYTNDIYCPIYQEKLFKALHDCDVSIVKLEALEGIQRLISENKLKKETLIKLRAEDKKGELSKDLNDEVSEKSIYIRKDYKKESKSDEFAGISDYEVFIKTIRKMYSKNDVFLMANIWNEFVGRNINSEKLINYIVSEKKLDFLGYLFSTTSTNDIKESLSVIENVIEKYFALEDLKPYIIDFFNKNYVKMSGNNAELTLNLVSKYPFLKNIKSGSSIMEDICIQMPDLFLSFLTDEQDKKYWSDFYNEKVIKNKESFALSFGGRNANIAMLKVKDKWYATTVGDNEDVVSCLIKGDGAYIKFLKEELKNNTSLRSYILERDNNALSESLIDNLKNSHKMSNMYNFLNGEFPELYQKMENPNCFLDSLWNFREYTDVKEKILLVEKTLKSYPLHLLLTNKPEKLLAFVNKNNNFEYENCNSKIMLRLSDIFVSAIKERYKNKLDDKLVKESLNKLELQAALQKEIYVNYRTEEYNCDDFLLNSAEANFDGLSWKSLKEFNFINQLISRGLLTERYLSERMVREEKEQINRQLKSLENGERIKKRL